MVMNASGLSEKTTMEKIVDGIVSNEELVKKFVKQAWEFFGIDDEISVEELKQLLYEEAKNMANLEEIELGDNSIMGCLGNTYLNMKEEGEEFEVIESAVSDPHAMLHLIAWNENIITLLSEDKLSELFSNKELVTKLFEFYYSEMPEAVVNIMRIGKEAEIKGIEWVYEDDYIINQMLTELENAEEHCVEEIINLISDKFRYDPQFLTSFNKNMFESMVNRDIYDTILQNAKSQGYSGMLSDIDYDTYYMSLYGEEGKRASRGEYFKEFATLPKLEINKQSPLEERKAELAKVREDNRMYTEKEKMLEEKLDKGQTIE